jgi:hypothetical protein
VSNDATKNEKRIIMTQEIKAKLTEIAQKLPDDTEIHVAIRYAGVEGIIARVAVVRDELNAIIKSLKEGE